MTLQVKQIGNVGALLYTLRSLLKLLTVIFVCINAHQYDSLVMPSKYLLAWKGVSLSAPPSFYLSWIVIQAHSVDKITVNKMSLDEMNVD
jgi:hypothetical protein